MLRNLDELNFERLRWIDINSSEMQVPDLQQ